MYYHLKDHIYITQFREEVILLDTKRDKYTICNNHISLLLITILEQQDKKNLIKNIETIQNLIDDNIIEEQNSPYTFYIDSKMDTKGVSNVDWRLPLDRQSSRMNFSVLKAFSTLLQVNFYIKVKGLYKTIKLIKKNLKEPAEYIIPSDKDLCNLSDIVNSACFIYPTRTKCLEWALTFVLLALKRRWKCNIEIGVQNYPFMAHAWVECNKKVISDSSELREGLSIILNEPFRRLK